MEDIYASASSHFGKGHFSTDSEAMSVISRKCTQDQDPQNVQHQAHVFVTLTTTPQKVGKYTDVKTRPLFLGNLSIFHEKD